MAKRKPDQLKPQGTDGEFLYRIAVVDVERVDRDERSLDLVLATESPIPVYDLSRGEVVDEVLKLSGMEMPKQVPLLDSHRRDSTRDVLGSIRNLRVEGDKLLGRAYFASDPESNRTFTNYAEGHLSDFSVGARRLEVDYEDDRRVVTRSQLVEGSAVVKGADPDAKAMSVSFRSYADPYSMKAEAMFEDLKTFLVERGLLKDDADDSAVIASVKQELTRKPEDADEHAKLLREISGHLSRIQSPEIDTDALEKKVLDAAKKAEGIERQRVREIDELCRSHGIDDDLQRKWTHEDNKSVEEVTKEILKRKASGGEPLGISFGQSDSEKFYNAASYALLHRSLTSQRLVPDNAIATARRNNDFDALQRAESLKEEFSTPAQGWKDLKNAGLMELARLFCERSGVRTLGMPNQTIARHAMTQGFLSRASDGPAFTSTGTFPALMLDAANKTLLQAYDEAAVTYPMWVRQAPSAPDFKNVNRIRFGELPDPDAVPEGHDYPDKAPSDWREFYRVQKYGEIFSITLEAVVNDDLDAISRIPAMEGNAMRRKINKAVYQLLADNPTLNQDSVAVFHATSHNANLDTTALSATALNTGFTVMMTQAGIQTGTVLNIMPRYLICGAALSDTALQILGSYSDPSNAAASTEDASRPNFNSGVVGLYGTANIRPLTPVIDGQIDSLDSTTAWYLAAAPSQVDTMELTFLRGEESPVLDREEGFVNDSIKYKIRQSWAVAIIDYRGLYQGNT